MTSRCDASLDQMRLVGRRRQRAHQRPLLFWVIATFMLIVGATFQVDVIAAEPRQRTRSVQVYGDDPCPRSSNDEIVVCGREPETERYRIPNQLREDRVSVPEQAWSNRVQTLDDVSRAGLPNSCSPVGSGGQTGCFARFRDQWRAERGILQSKGSNDK